MILIELYNFAVKLYSTIWRGDNGEPLSLGLDQRIRVQYRHLNLFKAWYDQSFVTCCWLMMKRKLVLVGDKGSGKTSLLNALQGLDFASSVQATVFDNVSLSVTHLTGDGGDEDGREGPEFEGEKKDNSRALLTW